MSYTRTYTSVINVSGTVSYPPSEHGGSVSYHESVPITANIIVDTTPFDASVINAQTDVDLLTGAVAAMESAQIATVKDNAEKISDRMIKGFYSLINYDISSQKTECGTLLKSKFLLLSQYAQNVLDMKNRMESDVARLRQHYGKIFSGIDSDMKSRIKKLDGEGFKLAEMARENTLLSPEMDFVPMCFTGGNESAELNGMVTMARIRRKTSSVIQSVSEYVSREKKFSDNLEKILDFRDTSAPETECIPVIIHTVDGEGAEDDCDFRCFSPEMKCADEIKTKVYEHFTGSNEIGWQKMKDDDLDRVDRAFSTCVARDAEQVKGNRDDIDRDRVFREIIRMWEHDKPVMKSLD